MSVSRVLILDDSAEVRELLRMAIELEHPAVAVTEASQLEEVVPLLGGVRPEAVIVDMMMYPADGVEAVSRLRPLLPDARLVVFSSAPYGESAREALHLGADAYIEKTQGHQAVLAAIGLPIPGG